jgi:hypothetical protein
MPLPLQIISSISNQRYGKHRGNVPGTGKYHFRHITSKYLDKRNQAILKETSNMANLIRHFHGKFKLMSNSCLEYVAESKIYADFSQLGAG